MITMSLKRILFTVLLVQTFILCNSQQKITGKVTSSEYKEGLPFATIVFKGHKPDTLIGATSMLNGKFNVKNIPAGVYDIEFSVLGYKKVFKRNVSIENKKIDLGTVKLLSESLTLEAVEVVAERSYIESKAGKKIINVKKDIVNAGGSAIEVLSMAPAVDVGITGNISIRGESDVFVLINGKETALTYLGASKALKKIPVSSIEKIEIITNAGAEFGPEGEGGMINVILKKEKREGLEVTIGGNYEMKPMSSSLTGGVEYKKEKFGLSLNYSVEKSNQESSAESERIYNKIVDGNRKLTEKTSGKGDGIMHFLMGGVSYNLNDSTEMSLNMYFENGENNEDNIQNYTILKDDNTSVSNRMNSSSAENEKMGGLEYEFNRSFGEESELGISLGASFGKISGNTKNKTDKKGISLISNSSNKNEFTNVNARVGYEFPVKEYLSIKSGVETDLLSFNVDQNTISGDDKSLSNYTFNQNKNALFLITNWQLLFFELGLGARAEYYISNGKPKGGDKFKQEYFNVYPNLQLTVGLSEGKVRNAIMLSYSKRINRPEYEELNPTVDYTDPLNNVIGNPNLKPEFAHVIELCHELSGSDLNMSTTLFHRITTNIIETRKMVSKQNVLLTTYVNESNRENSGVELFLKYNVTDWLYFSNDFTVFNKNFKNAGDDNNNVINWHNKLSCNIKPGAGFRVQMNFRYIGKESGLYYSNDPYHSLDLGISKDLFNSKARLVLGVSDIFNTIKLNSTYRQNDFVLNKKFKPITRMLKVGFTYNFNKK